jgi:hypothetical protein
MVQLLVGAARIAPPPARGVHPLKALAQTVILKDSPMMKSWVQEEQQDGLETQGQISLVWSM